MKVLSLFDGIGGAHQALLNLNIPHYYFSSEIDKYANAVHKYNHFYHEVGDITKLTFKSFPKIDLIVGGSPCTGLSIAKLNRQNLNDPRSALFFKFVEAIRVLKPKYFILENVASMNKVTRQVFTDYMEVEPIEIDSALLTAQSRKRLYWCNFKVTQPEDKNIILSNIIESGKADRQKAYCLDASYYKGPCSNPYHKSGRRQQVLEGSSYRMLTPTECEALQGFPYNYSKYGRFDNIKLISNTQRYKMLGNAFTVPVIEHILKHI